MLRIIPVIFEIFRDPVYRVLIFSVVSILAFGTIFYSIVEDWSMLDSLYFCVVTLTTIGYGDYAPKTSLGKIVTIFYIFAGIGIIAGFIGTVADRMSNEGPMWQKFRGKHPQRHSDDIDDGGEVDV